MTRSAFYDARLSHWKAEADPRIADPAFQALRDVEAAQAAGVKFIRSC
jgi:hypothetical protein